MVRFGQICDMFINNGGALIQRRVGHVNVVGIAGLGGAQGVWIFAAHSGGLRSEMKVVFL